MKQVSSCNCIIQGIAYRLNTLKYLRNGGGGIKMLTLATAGQMGLGWPWVDVITACAITCTGRMRTLEMSIVERGGVEVDGGDGIVRRMVGD